MVSLNSKGEVGQRESKMRPMVFIAVVFAVMLAFFAPAVAQQSSWQVEVQTGQKGVSLEAVCKKISANSPYQWKSKYQIPKAAGLALAKELLLVFNMPYGVRAEVQCLDGKLRFENGAMVVEIITIILDHIEATEKEFGQSKATLRQLLLKDLKGLLAWVRKEYEQGKGSVSDFYAPYVSEVGEAAKKYLFTDQQMVFNEQERKMLAGR
jgi:hypothetical protein